MTNYFGAKPRGSGTASKDLTKHADMSRSARLLGLLVRGGDHAVRLPLQAPCKQ
jgi:hypothetical protein